MTPLSPAAQAVLDAIDACDGESDVTVAAAALRAAVDQVVPEDVRRRDTYTTEAIRLNRAGTRDQLLAIAAALELAGPDASVLRVCQLGQW